MSQAVFQKTPIILDIDGTLWDSTAVVAAAWRDAAKSLSPSSYQHITPERLKQEFGKPMSEIARNLFPSLSPAERTTIMDICCQYEQRYLKECHHSLLFDGVGETIPLLARESSLFIVSNCQEGYIELFLEKNGFSPFIEDFESYGHTKLSKGENICLLMKRQGLEHAIYVGDTQGDCDACAYAQIPFIFASYGFGSPSSYAQKISCFSDLLSLGKIV